MKNTKFEVNVGENENPESRPGQIIKKISRVDPIASFGYFRKFFKKYSPGFFWARICKWFRDWLTLTGVTRKVNLRIIILYITFKLIIIL